MTEHVVFGTSAISRAVMNELVWRGESVRMVNRSGQMDALPAGVEIQAWDLYDQAQVREATRGARVVYQIAQPKYFEWESKFPALQKSILDGMRGSKAKIVVAENLYMYGRTHGTPMTEDMPHNTHTRKGKLRSALSQAALAAHHAGDVNLTIARGSDIFGPWALHTSIGDEAFIPLVKGRTAIMIGRLDVPHTQTYVNDFGKALVTLGERPEADGQVWHVPNDMPRATQRDLMQMFATAAGVQAKMIGSSTFMNWLAGFFYPEMKELVEMMYSFNEPHIVDSTKFETTFGVKATPMQTAMQETAEWFAKRYR